MKIIVKNEDELERRHACWGIHSRSHEYQVLAITHQRSISKYLVEHDNRLDWWDADLFLLVDNTIPNEWVEIHLKKHQKFQNPKYDFDISISYYRGPKAFWDNINFFFDIYENPSVAYEFYRQTVGNSI